MRNPPLTMTISPETRVGDLLARWPAVVEVFAAFHLGDTTGTRLPRAHTLERLAVERSVPLDMLLTALRGWMEEHGSGVDH
jgi:hypothetical protein